MLLICERTLNLRMRSTLMARNVCSVGIPRLCIQQCNAAAPAQRFRGRTLEDTAPAPRCSRNHRAAATQHHCCQPAAMAQAARHAAGSLTSTGDSAASASTIEKIWPSRTTTPATASPDPCLGATNGRKIACEVLFTLLQVFDRANVTVTEHTHI